MDRGLYLVFQARPTHARLTVSVCHPVRSQYPALAGLASSPYTVTDIQLPYCYILRLQLAGLGTCNIPQL